MELRGSNVLLVHARWHTVHLTNTTRSEHINPFSSVFWVMDEAGQRIRINTFAGLFLVVSGIGLYAVTRDLVTMLLFLVVGTGFFLSARWQVLSS